MKTVSVVLCTYNGEKYIREQIDSILNQEYLPKEIIIQDDGSTDGTLSVIQEYAEKEPIIKILKNNRGRGINSNFFDAMSKASGDYIAISDQDDIWAKEKLKWQVESIGDKLLCSGISVPFPMENRDTRLVNYNLLRILHCNCLPGHTFLLSRELLKMVPDIEKMPDFTMYDCLLALVAASFNSIVYIEKPLVYHRMHQESATYTSSVNRKKSLRNICSHVINDFRLVQELKDEVREIRKEFLHFMMKIQSSEEVYADAITMLKLETSQSRWDFLRLQLFCLRHCDKLFYVTEKKTPLTMLRGLFFPISYYEYYRGLSKRHPATHTSVSTAS